MKTTTNPDNGYDEFYRSLPVEELKHPSKGDNQPAPPEPPPAWETDVTTMEPLKYRTSWTDTELLAATFPDPNWAVNGYIPEGLTILGGRPKVGKSILALQLALSVKTGGKFLDQQINPGNVLYFALEDNGRRLLERMQALNWQNGGDYHVQFETELTPLHKPEGLNELFVHLSRENYKLMVLDTVERALSGADKSDEKIMGPVYHKLQALAIQRQMAIIVIDHLRKPNGLYSDPIDDIIGSTAKTGIADTVIALTRERGKAEHNLRGRGRDIIDFDLQIQFDSNTHCYQLIGDTVSLELTERRTEILDALAELGTVQSNTIADYIEQDRGNTKKRLYDLVNFNKVRKEKRDGKVFYSLL